MPTIKVLGSSSLIGKYFIDTNFGAILASVYNVDYNYKDDFLAWPYWADEINLKNSELLCNPAIDIKLF